MAIEADLDDSVRYVEPREQNFSAFSIEFAKILLASSSEVDVVCRVMANEIDPGSDPQNIDDHRQIIVDAYPRFPEMRIIVPRYQLTFEPWKEWADGINPDWWHAYNSVKHERNKNFDQANQLNAFSSVAGLFSLLAYMYHQELFRGGPNPWPRILDIEGNPSAVFQEDRYRLPDFNRYYPG